MNIVVEEISFKSGEAKIVGRLYRPEEVGGKFPSVVLCHGFPGDTKNVDLAEDLAFNGYVALVFYYQGVGAAVENTPLQSSRKTQKTL